MAGIYAKKPEGNFIMIEAGTYKARCVSMIEIGTIPVDFQGNTKMQHKVQLGWETCDEKAIFDAAKGEQPFFVTKEYTLSMHENAVLRKDLESWRGKVYSEDEAKNLDVTKLLGQPCMLTIIQEAGKKDPSKKYAKVANVSKPMKGDPYPPQMNPTRLLCFEDFDWELYASLSDYMKDKIKISEEFKRLQSPGEIHDEHSVNDAVNDENEPPF